MFLIDLICYFFDDRIIFIYAFDSHKTQRVLS